MTRKINASSITKMLSDLGGGSIKNGGQGMMGGLEKIIQMVAQITYQAGFNDGVKATMMHLHKRR